MKLKVLFIILLSFSRQAISGFGPQSNNGIDSISVPKVTKNIPKTFNIHDLKTYRQNKRDKLDKSELEKADKILAIIYHEEGNTIITESDLKASLDGRAKTLKEAILEKLMIFDAEHLKVTITEADVDRNLIQVQKQFNLTRDDTIELFKSMGYTLEEGREQLKNKLIIETIVDHRVKAKVIVDKKEIERYYHENPEYEEACYEIVQSFYPYNGSSEILSKIKIERAIEDNEIDKLVSWGSPITLQENQISKDKSFIKDLEPEQSAIINITNDGISIIKLLTKTNKTLLSLKDRESQIMNELAQPRFAKAMEDYQAKLFESALIKYLD